VQEALVRVGPLVNLPALVRELGHDPEPVFSGLGFRTAEFSSPDNLVPYLPASRLLARCVQRTGATDLGLMLGERAHPGHLGLPGYLLLSAPDVGTALRDLLAYLKLHDQGGIPTLMSDREFTRLGYSIVQPGAEAVEQIGDLALVMVCKIMRALCGPDWNPTEALFLHGPPANPLHHRHIFRAPLRFESGENALVFPTRWLAHLPVSGNPLLHAHLEQEARTLQLQRVANLSESLRPLVRRTLLDGHCVAGAVARQLGMHERTLHRHLRAEGTSFRQELESGRRTLGLQLLENTRLPLEEIALALCYTNASAFCRAFKRWTGTTPGRWRSERADPL